MGKEDLNKGTVLTENVATIFIMDTLLASADGRKLDEYMMEKHKWDTEKYKYYLDIYRSWMIKRSSNIDMMGNIKSNKWDKLNSEFEAALEKFDEWTPRKRNPIEAAKHEVKIREFAIEYSNKTTLESVNYAVKLFCERDFMAGFYKCYQLQLESKKESGYEEGVYGYKTSIIDPLAQFGKNNFDPKKCQAGCKVFSGGERKHHNDCTYYKDSLSELLDERNEELNGYKEAYEDHKRLVREIDVILCGKDAAQQASLCDLVSPIRELREQLNNMQEKVWDELKRKTVDTEKYGAVIPIQTLVKALFKTQITKENENNFNATTVSKLRNQLSPYYSLPSMILAMDEHPDLKPLLIEQAKQAISTQDKIKELLTEIENESK